jgi:hypothetical protein
MLCMHVFCWIQPLCQVVLNFPTFTLICLLTYDELNSIYFIRFPSMQHLQLAPQSQPSKRTYYSFSALRTDYSNIGIP